MKLGFTDFDFVFMISGIKVFARYEKVLCSLSYKQREAERG